jgi:hypothetical protein
VKIAERNWLPRITDGNRILALTEDPQKMIEATAEGQVVFAIDVAPIVRTLEDKVTEIGAPREIDVRARRRTYRAVLTPDLEAGGTRRTASTRRRSTASSRSGFAFRCCSSGASMSRSP